MRATQYAMPADRREALRYVAVWTQAQATADIIAAQRPAPPLPPGLDPRPKDGSPQLTARVRAIMADADGPVVLRTLAADLHTTGRKLHSTITHLASQHQIARVSYGVYRWIGDT